MNRRATLAGLAALGATTARAQTLGPAATPGVPGRFVDRAAFASAFVRPRDVRVWIPAAWRAGHPVLYMHDAQNVFDACPGPFGAWGVETVLDRLIAARQVRPALVVAVANTPLRGPEYLPAKPFARLPAAYRAKVRGGWKGEPLSDGYVRFLADELKPWVDATFRPSPRREETLVMGSSMGGLISLYAAGERPEVFGGAACLSTHWPLYAPGPDYAPTPEEAAAVGRAFGGWLGGTGLKAGRTRLYFDHGDRGLDAAYAPFQARIDADLEALGWREGVDFVSRAYPGGDHNEASWKARLDVPLRFLLPRPA